MKLINMTTFVLKCYEKNDNYQNIADECLLYANFLSQPLTLGMFVPCDDDGNVLEEPICENQNESQQLMEFAVKSKIFDTAKSKVLFDGFNSELYSENCHISIVDGCFRLKTKINYRFLFFTGDAKIIEDLIPYNLDLLVSF